MADYTSIYSGAEIDEGIGLAFSANQLKPGYLYNNVFYTTDQHTTAITANTKFLYIDLTLSANTLYRYDGTNYIQCGGSGGGGSGNVDDVRINNVSILLNRIANITVDNALSNSSSNPVMNSVINQAIEDLRVELANFIGNFPTEADLEAYSGTLSKNDFAVVQADETHSNQCSMYIYSGSVWQYKYKINDTPFTSTQMDAINSGANTTNIGQITTNQNNIGTMSNLITGENDLVSALNNRVAIAQGVANAGKQLIVNALGNVVLDTIKVSRSFETLTIDSNTDTFYVETTTDGTNTLMKAISLDHLGLIYISVDGTNWYLPYSEWRA